MLFRSICVTLSIVGVGFTLFSLAVKYLPVFPEAKEPWAADAPIVIPGADGAHEGQALVIDRAAAERILSRTRPAFGKRVLAGLWILLLAGFLAVGYSRNARGPAAPGSVASTTPVAIRTAALKLPADYDFPKGKQSPGAVRFSHGSHVDTRNPSCGPCHNGPFRLTVAGQPVFGEMTEKRIHEGDLCASCHNGKAAFSVQDDCSACHQ